MSTPDPPSETAAVCDRPDCIKPMTCYDAWGQWCDAHNGGRGRCYLDCLDYPACPCGRLDSLDPMEEVEFDA